MPKSITPSFVTELPLVISSQIDQELMARFQAGRQLYNACLTEAMVRVGLIKKSDTYQKALSSPRTITKKKKSIPNPERKKTKKGKNIQVKCKCNNSNAYLKLAAKKRELERRKSAYSKSQNRKVINEILRHGKHIKTENVSVKGWQKRYGKAIGAKSPGFVESELKRKAESAGGSFQFFSTRKTALSQTHLTGERIKKSLSQRVHRDRTGVVMHRDLFSAYLARYVNDEDNLLLQSAQTEYPRSEPILKSAWQEFQINCERVSGSESRLSHSSSEQFDLKLGIVSQANQSDYKLTGTLSQNPLNSI